MSFTSVLVGYFVSTCFVFFFSFCLEEVKCVRPDVDLPHGGAVLRHWQISKAQTSRARPTCELVGLSFLRTAPPCKKCGTDSTVVLNL